MRGVTDSSLTPSSWRVARGVCRLEIAHVSAVFTARDGARRRRPTRAGTRRWAWQARFTDTARLPFSAGMIWMILIANPSTVRIATHTVIRIACLKYENIMR